MIHTSTITEVSMTRNSSNCFVCSQSDGVEQTNYLAQHYCQEAIRQISRLRPSTERDALIRLTELVLRRDKWGWTQSSTLRQLHLCRALLTLGASEIKEYNLRCCQCMLHCTVIAEPWPPLTSVRGVSLVQKDKLCKIIVIPSVAQMEVLLSPVCVCGSVTDAHLNIRPH